MTPGIIIELSMMLKMTLCPENRILENAYAAREPKNRLVATPTSVVIKLFNSISKNGIVSKTVR